MTENVARGLVAVDAVDISVLVDNVTDSLSSVPADVTNEVPVLMKRTADGRDWEPDPWIMDERYVAVNVRGKGVVVFTACSHAGVVNVLTDARNVFGDVPLHAVMGGFHLSGGYVEDIIPDTIADMKRFGLKRIVPAHCTGWRAVNALAQTFGEGVIVPSAVGRQFRF